MLRLRLSLFLLVIAQTLGAGAGMVLCLEPSRGEVRLEVLALSSCENGDLRSGEDVAALREDDCGGCQDLPLLLPAPLPRDPTLPSLQEAEGPPEPVSAGGTLPATAFALGEDRRRYPGCGEGLAEAASWNALRWVRLLI